MNRNDPPLASLADFDALEPVRYEGPESTNPLAFRWYDPDASIEGKTMREHLRFSVVYWHTMRGTGADPFGAPTMRRPWDDGSDSLENAERRVRIAFRLMEKLGAPFYAFHDRDVAPEGRDLAATNRNLDAIVRVLREEQERTGIGLLWGTANLFSHPRYAQGAATNPDPEVFAFAAAQVKKAIEITHELGGSNYVFWGGREGYANLLGTDMARELDHMARFLAMASDHARSIGFDGTLLIEPKPKEPMKHQYDSDAAACLQFLQANGLTDRFKLNIETNHATLAGHTMQHELRLAAKHGMLGSIDANRGDLLLGWDTDQFPTDIYQTTRVMLEVLAAGGLAPGGVNFDAKVRRESVEPIDLLHAHVGGMDAFARGLRIAAAIREGGELERFVRERYAGYDEGIGAKIEAGDTDFSELEAFALERGEASPTPSGCQERLENLLNRFL